MGVYHTNTSAVEILSQMMRLWVRVISLVTGAINTGIVTGAFKVEMSDGVLGGAVGWV